MRQDMRFARSSKRFSIRFAFCCILILSATVSETSLPATPLTFRARESATSNGLRLVLTSDIGGNPIHLDNKRVIRAYLENRGVKPVTLVKPGDGSWEAWRTPVEGWSVLPVDSPAKHTSLPTKPQFRDCGNLDSVTEDQVFILRPGERRTLGWWPDFPGPGRYRVVFRYRNLPQMKWHGIFEAAPGIMDKIRRSTPCDLLSNELTVTVIP